MRDWEEHYDIAERCLERALQAVGPEAFDEQIKLAHVHAILATIKHIGDGLDRQ